MEVELIGCSAVARVVEGARAQTSQWVMCRIGSCETARSPLLESLASLGAAVRLLDFRSDTVTRPTPDMREAMAAAEVGDDVMGEDPTVNELEATVAKRLGFEAALFVPSGTMANQIALWAHTGRQGQVVAQTNSHIALYEGGAAALLSGTTVRTVEGQNGVFTPDEVEAHLYPDDPHFAATRVVSTENTHNWSGGRCWSEAQTRAIADHAHDHGVALHVDGARVFNAATALDTTADRLLAGAGADTAMTCLSKGLGAPVGSLLCGTEAFIHQARRVRKALGGGMRQAGILAAAGLWALEHGAPRLGDDHLLARHMAHKIDALPGLAVDLESVQTNMVMVDTSGIGMSGPAFCEAAMRVGIGILPRDNGPTARFVTHLDVGQADADEAVARLERLLVDLRVPA